MAVFMADMRDPQVAQKLQKIALFLEKMLKIGGFETFWPKSWDICSPAEIRAPNGA